MRPTTRRSSVDADTANGDRAEPQDTPESVDLPPSHTGTGGADAAAGPRPPDSASEPEVIRTPPCALAGADVDDRWPLTAEQAALFRRHLPMARTLAVTVTRGHRPTDPAAVNQAAELGLLQAVLGWRRPDSTAFELFAHVAIAAALDALPAPPPAEPGIA